MRASALVMQNSQDMYRAKDDKPAGGSDAPLKVLHQAGALGRGRKRPRGSRIFTRWPGIPA